jgi:hypothetical protein
MNIILSALAEPDESTATLFCQQARSEYLKDINFTVSLRRRGHGYFVLSIVIIRTENFFKTKKASNVVLDALHIRR